MGRDEVRSVEVKLVDFVFMNKLDDFDNARGVERNGVQLLGSDLNVLPLLELISFDDVGVSDLFASGGIDLFVFDAVASLRIKLIEADLFAL